MRKVGQPMGNEYKLALSVTETAEILGLSRPTVYDLIQREDFPSFRVGRRTTISRSGLERWVQEQSKTENKAASGREVGI